MKKGLISLDLETLVLFYTMPFQQNLLLLLSLPFNLWQHLHLHFIIIVFRIWMIMV